MFFDLYECIFFSPLLFYGGLLQKAATKTATKIRSKYYLGIRYKIVCGIRHKIVRLSPQ